MTAQHDFVDEETLDMRLLPLHTDDTPTAQLDADIVDAAEREHTLRELSARLGWRDDGEAPPLRWISARAAAHLGVSADLVNRHVGIIVASPHCERRARLEIDVTALCAEALDRASARVSATRNEIEIVTR